MADTPKPSEAPDGFWEEMSSWLLSDDTHKQKVLDLFSTRNEAPSPQPSNEEGAKTDKPKKRGWFSNE